MAIYKWCKGNVPNGIKVKQVYGIIFTLEGEMLVAIDRGHYTLAGGKPEPQDENLEATLKREIYEEVNITVGESYIVGYQLVDDENGKEPYAQVRMTAVIERMEDITPDPASGRIFDRVLTKPHNAATLLAWGKVGEQQINDAMVIASQKWGIVFG